MPMTKKIEKLKEINVIIDEKLMELETLMFMEKIYEVNEIGVNEKPTTLIM